MKLRTMDNEVHQLFPETFEDLFKLNLESLQALNGAYKFCPEGTAFLYMHVDFIRFVGYKSNYHLYSWASQVGAIR